MKKIMPLILVLAMFGAACQSNTTLETSVADDEQLDGNDDSGNASTVDAAPTQEAEPTADAPEPTTPPEPTAVPDPAPTEAPAADAGGDDSTDDEPTPEPEPTDEPEEFEPSADDLALIQSIQDAGDWCAAAELVETGTDDLDNLDFTNPIELEAGFTVAIAAITAAQPLAPAEIAADVDQSVEAFTALGVALEDANWSFLDLDLAVIEQFDGPMEMATYNIDVYNSTICGLDIDPGEPPTVDGTDTTEEADDTPLPTDGTIREQAVAGLVEAGFTAEEANCIINGLDLSDPTAMQDVNAILALFTECGIPLDRLAQLGG